MFAFFFPAAIYGIAAGFQGVDSIMEGFGLVPDGVLRLRGNVGSGTAAEQWNDKQERALMQRDNMEHCKN